MIRNSIAAACILAVFASAAPALAGGKGHGYRGGNWGGHGSYYRYKGYRNDDAALFAGGLLFGAIIGSLTAPRTVYVAPPPPPPAAYVAPPAAYVPPQPALTNCRTIFGNGYWYGRPAVFEGIGCYDAYGNMYPQPGSERFHRYLD